jgi:hypothetical protein
MEQINCSLDPRSFQALLNGIIKRQFYNQSTFTNDFLIEQLYNAESDQNDIISEIEIFEQVKKI